MPKYEYNYLDEKLSVRSIDKRMPLSKVKKLYGDSFLFRTFCSKNPLKKKSTCYSQEYIPEDKQWGEREY